MRVHQWLKIINTIHSFSCFCHHWNLPILWSYLLIKFKTVLFGLGLCLGPHRKFNPGDFVNGQTYYFSTFYGVKMVKKEDGIHSRKNFNTIETFERTQDTTQHLIYEKRGSSKGNIEERDLVRNNTTTVLFFFFYKRHELIPSHSEMTSSLHLQPLHFHRLAFCNKNGNSDAASVLISKP